LNRSLSIGANKSGKESVFSKHKGRTFEKFSSFFVWILISSSGCYLLWKFHKQRAHSNTKLPLKKPIKVFSADEVNKGYHNKLNTLAKGMRMKYKDGYELLMSILGTPMLLTKVSYVVNG
jgi:hypothetical protein